MKKILKYLLVFLFFFCFLVNVEAKENVTLYFFHGNGCPHCAEEEENLIKKLDKRDDVKVVKYEVWYNEKNAKILDKISETFNKGTGVPYNVIGDTVILGYNDSNKTQIERAIKYYNDNND